MSVDDILDAVMRDVSFYETSLGGVTLSGGEPLAQPTAALELLHALRREGVHTALDTCGAASEAAFREALEVIDLLLLDIKSVDPIKHARLTGAPFERIERAAQLAGDSGVRIWVRTPIIPGYTDGEAEVRAVARFVAEILPNCERHDLLAFSNICASKYGQLDRPFALEGVPLIRAATMERLRSAAAEEGSTTAQWSGPTRIEEVVGP
jgi:pyruvate formate lyase activating enzyme